MTLEAAITDSVKYLASPEAAESIRRNPYWPKWNSPWWHMSLLFEMGLAKRIPEESASLMLAEIKRTHLPYFFREDAPPDKAPDQEAPCPCALGNIYQILTAIGLEVDRELPWARGWFLKYQMPDGGLSCDEDAYKADPCASSLVGTIAPLEAILKTRESYTEQEEQFLDRGANCLLERELRFGSSSQHNAEEREDEADWLQLCFPRFYFYDVLRGLNFVLLWSKKRQMPLQWKSIEAVVSHLKREFPTGLIHIQRQSYEGVSDRKRQPASYFELLHATSLIGQASPFPAKQWELAQLLLTQLQCDCLIKK